MKKYLFRVKFVASDAEEEIVEIEDDQDVEEEFKEWVWDKIIDAQYEEIED